MVCVGEEVEVFRQARPSFWLRGTIVKVDRIDKSAASAIVQIYAESQCDDSPLEGGWYRMADNVIRALRPSSHDYKTLVTSSTPSVSCLPLFYRAFLHAHGPEAVMQLLESTYTMIMEARDDQQRWSVSRIRELTIRVIWACDWIIRRSCMSSCRGDMVTPRRPASRAWWDHEALVTSLQRLNNVMAIPVECVHALCTIAFGEYHTTSRHGHAPVYDIDGLATRSFDNGQHWIVHALIYSLTNTTLVVAKSGLKFFNFLLTRSDTVATAILAQHGWQRWFACLLTGVGGGPATDEPLVRLSADGLAIEAKNDEPNTLTLTFGMVIMILFRHFCDFDVRLNTETNPGVYTRAHAHYHCIWSIFK